LNKCNTETIREERQSRTTAAAAAEEATAEEATAKHYTRLTV